MLRLVQIAVLGALVAALGAEIAAALAAGHASAPRFLAPPTHALHPFVPVFAGMLILPTVIGGLGLVLGGIYRAAMGAGRPLDVMSSFAVAVRGAVPIHVGLALLPLPFGGVAAATCVLLSMLAWAGGYGRALRVQAGHGAQLFGIGALAALGVLPMLGALLATLA